jgi:hypothetical protein
MLTAKRRDLTLLPVKLSSGEFVKFVVVWLRVGLRYLGFGVWRLGFGVWGLELGT